MRGQPSAGIAASSPPRWTSCRPRWRTYTGSNPHTGHGHVELIPTAAATLTAARIEQVIGGGSKPAPPASPPNTNWGKEIVDKMRTIDLRGVTSNSSTWVRGDHIGVLQGELLAHGYGPDGLVDSRGRPDKVAGPATRRLLGEAQRRFKTGSTSNRSQPDFVAGRLTRAALNLVKL